MKVQIAQSAGFCMGVRKAIDCVLEVAHGSKVTYTLGPLIHNPQALEMLETRNIRTVHTIDTILAGKTVVTRAHGITLDARKQLEEVGAHIVDATCPNVLKSQGIIKKYHSDGYTIIIVGDRGHAEIESLLSYTDGAGKVIETIDEARQLPMMDRVCVVAQTTFDSTRFEEIAEEVCCHAQVSYIADTVCASTERRQDDIRKLAEITDATVVVGGRNSANTNRLAEISRSLNQPTFLVEDYTELDLEELSRYNEIGVTAGASTPNWVIKQVVDTIAGYSPTPHPSFTGYLMSLAFFAIEGNLVICSGAAALTYAMCRFMGIPPYPHFILMAFFYLFPLHAINKYFEINWNYLSTTRQVSRLRKYWWSYLIIGFISSVISLLIAGYYGVLLFILVLVSYLFGGLYSVRVIPGRWNLRLTSLRDIPGSKDVMIATAWTFASVAIPIIGYGTYPGFTAIIAGVFVFILVLSRATIIALTGIQSDKIVGLETIPVLIGRKYTLNLLYGANILLAGVLITLVLTGALDLPKIIFIVPVVYMVVWIKVLSRLNYFFTLYHQMVLDATFFLTGLIAYLFL